MCRKYYIVLLCIISAIGVQHIDGAPSELLGGKGVYEGDMILSNYQAAYLYSPVQSRNALHAPLRRWPDKTVIYKFGAGIGEEEKNIVLKNMDELQRWTCIIFRPAGAADLRYVMITSIAPGCTATVGYQDEDWRDHEFAQKMNLGPFCFQDGTVLHELMHVIGFFHQHSVWDRDNYLNINLENVNPSERRNFRVYPKAIGFNLQAGYDYESILHYGPYTFSANGGQTIVAKDPTKNIGQRVFLSVKDVHKIKELYGCGW